MILSVSRRTDIPCYYSSWFFKRIAEGFVHVRNPRNKHKVSRIDITPDAVDCMVFWTKNPLPMLDCLQKIESYKYYFQFTLTPYGKDIEPGLPQKSVLTDGFRRLSDKIGCDNVIWRYDPVFLNKKYDMTYHIENFEKLASLLLGYTNKCIMSFIDFYPKISGFIDAFNINIPAEAVKYNIAKALSEISKKYGMSLFACAEDIDLTECGILPARCIDSRHIELLTGHKLKETKDRNQRLLCGCIASVDIGTYNSCMNGCKYCYANNRSVVGRNFSMHDPDSSLYSQEYCK